MKNKIVLVRNFSYDGFLKQAEALRRHLTELGADAEIADNLDLSLRKDEELQFDKAVFLDKDIPLGLRMERLGIRLYNSIHAIERCDDKRRLPALLGTSVKMPETLVFPLSFSEGDASDCFVKKIGALLGYPVVAKGAYGSLGNQVVLLQNEKEVRSYQKAHRVVPHLYQKYIAESSGRDMRLYVVGGRTVAAMIRENRTDFRANLAQGGTAMPFTPSAALQETAAEVCLRLGLDFAGVDFLFSDEGEPYLCEVNSNAFFTGISACTGVDVAREISLYILRDASPSGKSF